MLLVLLRILERKWTVVVKPRRSKKKSQKIHTSRKSVIPSFRYVTSHHIFSNPVNVSWNHGGSTTTSSTGEHISGLAVSLLPSK